MEEGGDFVGVAFVAIAAGAVILILTAKSGIKDMVDGRFFKSHVNKSKSA